MQWSRKHLLGLEDLSRSELIHILETTESLKQVSTRTVKKISALSGRTVVNMFYEPSTRTSLSFTLAQRRVSADVLSFSKSGSSASKGETLIDTAKNIEAMGVDIMVLRHDASGAAKLLSENVGCGVINAGDGQHEHPTQALLDIYTMYEVMKERDDLPNSFEDVTIAIVGDITHSRVARSNIWGLITLGAKVIVVGPATMIPPEIEKMGVEVCYDMDEAIKRADFINMLRIQFERQNGVCPFPSIREYTRLFGLSTERLERLDRKDLVIMHPGPVNRGIELTPEVADGEQSVILQQVENGVAVRMAVLYLINGALGCETPA